MTPSAEQTTDTSTAPQRFSVASRCGVMLCLRAAIVVILGCVSYFRGLWVVIPIGQSRAIYMDSFDGVLSIDWHYSDPPDVLFGPTTGVWRTGTDQSPSIVSKSGSSLSPHCPAIRLWYIDVQAANLPWIDIGTLTFTGPAGEKSNRYLVVSHWIVVIALLAPAVILFLVRRSRPPTFSGVS